jgi:hypothetical protein
MSLAESIEGGWVPSDVWPYCDALKGWLRERGVSEVKAELPMHSGECRGVCDAFTCGRSPDERGLLEFKTLLNSDLPDQPNPRAIFQIGLYASLDATPAHLSGTVAYFSVRNRTIRFFTWNSLGDCAAAAERLAA